MAESFNSTVAIRMHSADRDAFNERCKKLAREPAAMHRELIIAFAEKRISITPTADQKAATQEIYHD